MEMDKKFKDKIYSYLDEYAFINESEVNMAVQDYFMEEEWLEQTSFGDCLRAWEIAEQYIKDRNIKFEADLVMSIDSENKIHLSDLNNVLNEKQVERLQEKCRNAFLNACDCLYYWYGRNDWNKCKLDDWLARRVRECAKNYMCNARDEVLHMSSF